MDHQTDQILTILRMDQQVKVMTQIMVLDQKIVKAVVVVAQAIVMDTMGMEMAVLIMETVTMDMDTTLMEMGTETVTETAIMGMEVGQKKMYIVPMDNSNGNGNGNNDGNGKGSDATPMDLSLADSPRKDSALESKTRVNRGKFCNF